MSRFGGIPVEDVEETNRFGGKPLIEDAPVSRFGGVSVDESKSSRFGGISVEEIEPVDQSSFLDRRWKDLKRGFKQAGIVDQALVAQKSRLHLESDENRIAEIDKGISILEKNAPNSSRIKQLKKERARTIAKRDQTLKTLVGSFENIGKLEMERASIPISEGYGKWANSADGEGWKTFLENPVEVISSIATESITGSLPTLATTTIGSFFGPAGTTAGAGVGTLAQEQANALIGYLQDEGIDIRNANQMKAAFSDKELMNKLVNKSLKRAAPIAIVSAISGGTAGKLIPKGATGTQLAKGLATEAVVQTGMEGLGELGGQVAAGEEIAPKGIAAEMMGSIPQSAVESGTGFVSRQASSPILDTTIVGEPIESAQESTKEISRIERAFPRMHRVISENFPDAAKKAVRLVSRPRTAKGFKESEAGLEALDRVNKAVTGGGIIFGENTATHETAIDQLNMNDKKWARENFKEAYESGGVAAMPNERLKAYAEAWSKIEDRVGAKAEELNVMVRDDRKDEDGNFLYEGGKRPFKRSIDNFFPRRLTTNVQNAFKKKKGRIYEALIKEMKERNIPIVGLDDASTTIEKASKYGHLESARIGDLPETVTTRSGEIVQVQEKDPFKVIENYINGASQRLSLIEAFTEVDEDGNVISGQDAARGVAERISLELGETHPDTQREWNAMWDALNGVSEKADADSLVNTGLATPLRVAENIARVAQLSTATISQIGGGWLPIAVRGGAWNTVKAGLQYAKMKIGASPKTRAELDMTRNMGAWDHYVMGHTYELEDIPGLTQTIARKGLTATGFVASNRMLNQIGSMVALRDFVDSINMLRSDNKDSIARKLWGKDHKSVRQSLRQNYEFTPEEIDGMINDGIDYADIYRVQDKARTEEKFRRAYMNLAQAAQKMTANTNLFRESVANRPAWQSKKAARMFMAYMSYMRQMSNNLSDALKQAKHGNLRPLATLLVGGTLAGATIDELKDLLFKRDGKPNESAFDTLKILLDWQLESGLYGLAGSMSESAYWGIKLRQPAGLDMPLLDFWTTNIIGIGKSAIESDGEEAYKALAKSTPIVRAIDAQLEGPLYQSKDKATKTSTDLFQ